MRDQVCKRAGRVFAFERLECRRMFSAAVAGLYNTPMLAARWAAFTAAAVDAAPAEVPPPTTAPVASVIRIDTGRGPHTDLRGRTWARDEGFVIGGSTSIAPYEVAKTFEDPLYYTRRWGNFEYTLPVPNATFDVRLHFADPVYTAPGHRRFNVYAENKLVLDRFDVAANGGGKSAIVRSVIVNVTDGVLDLRFRSVVENAILSAIEVLPRATAGWTAMSNAPVATTESQAAAVAGKLYVFGGFTEITASRATRLANVYDPDADTWTKIAELPKPITAAGTAADGNTVWLVGGYVGDASVKVATRDVWKYDTIKDVWTAGPALPKAVAGSALVRLGRKLHLIGGTDSLGFDLVDHYVFDIDRPELGWRVSASLPVARHHLAGVALNGKILAIGGQQGGDRAAGRIVDVHSYDWVTNRWTAVASLPAPRSHFASSTFIGAANCVLIAGGLTNGDYAAAARSDIIQYDAATNAWSHHSWMPDLRVAPVARFLSNRLVVTTGAAGNGAPKATTWTHLP
jgi:hypothetical protein